MRGVGPRKWCPAGSPGGYASVSTMRPLSRPVGRSWTTTFPIRKRASLIVSGGSAERRRGRRERRERRENFSEEFLRVMRAKDMGRRLRGTAASASLREKRDPDTPCVCEGNWRRRGRAEQLRDASHGRNRAQTG